MHDHDKFLLADIYYFQPAQGLAEVCRYESVVFASTSISVSLALDHVKMARCRDKVLPVPERRYEGLRSMKPSALINRCTSTVTCDGRPGNLISICVPFVHE